MDAQADRADVLNPGIDLKPKIKAMSIEYFLFLYELYVYVAHDITMMFNISLKTYFEIDCM